ncbi:MAG: 8-amino-7-oxononanoate synthase [Verrucomicrobia bacterium]|nr:8-amino-7-oxononanoate synthase [Verrucomicrobiota bacterium]MDE3099399.1 8-amino-7-oxononanoate synthase [Verrucomicrobiota bacterium]
MDEYLASHLDGLRGQNLFRELRRVDSPQSSRIQMEGRTFVNFSSNDYLGLANHAVLKEAGIKAIEEFGAGAGASRLVCGSLAPFHELEETIAAFKKTEGALAFSTGYAAAVGTICALLDTRDVIVLDKLVHASIVDAAKLCGATLRIFAHNDLNELEARLKWAANRQSRALIVTESIFSMDGDAAPLRDIVALKEKFGAWLMVDEAHATGVRGHGGRGLADELGVAGAIELQMGTLGKALGAGGGYLCGSRTLIDFLVNRARSFIFSTAPVPAAAAAATAAIGLVESDDGAARRERLWKRIAEARQAIQRFGRLGESGSRETSGAIFPMICGDEAAALAAAAALRERNIYVPAIRFPAVARGKARLRITVTAEHTPEDIQALADALKAAGKIF